MVPEYWWRWLAEHGAARLLLRTHQVRRDPSARLFNGREGLHDPYPLIESLRGHGALVRTPVSWVAFDHALVRTILRDNRFGVRLAVPPEVTGFLRRRAEGVVVPPNPVEAPSMLVIDAPEHTRMRRPVSSAFTPRAIARLRDRVESVTEELLDDLAAAPTADLIGDYAARLPIAIIAEMLGFPQADRDLFLRWGDHITPLLDLGIGWGSYRRAMRAIEPMNAYLTAHIERLRREPGEDILSTVVTENDLTTDELLANASLLMGAGFETTVNLIGNAVAALSTRPDQVALLREDPDRWRNAVEETMRFDPPVQTTARRALEPLEIGGVQVRTDTTIVLSLAGANRDPAVFTDPARFDVTRENAREHLGFSNGVHACLGASLARMEAEHALRALYTRFPDLRVDGVPQRRKLFTLHGFEHLPVRLGRDASVAQPVG